MENLSNTPRPITRMVDPYESLYLNVLPDLRTTTGMPVELDERQIAVAVALMAALIAACDLIPSVDGDLAHPRVLAGLQALTAVAQWQSSERNGGITRG